MRLKIDLAAYLSDANATVAERLESQLISG